MHINVINMNGFIFTAKVLTSKGLIFTELNKSSAVAEMGDHLATIDLGRKVGRGCCGGESPLGPHLTQ